MIQPIEILPTYPYGLRTYVQTTPGVLLLLECNFHDPQ